MNEDFIYYHPVLSFVATLVVGGGILFAIGYFGSRQSCAETWADSGMPSRYSLIAGCQVQKNGKWIPDSAFRVTETSN